VTQDQRNSLRARVRFQSAPTHLAGDGRTVWQRVAGRYWQRQCQYLLAAFGQQILDRVDLARRRVRPNLALDGAAGAEIYHKESRSAACRFRWRTWQTGST